MPQNVKFNTKVKSEPKKINRLQKPQYHEVVHRISGRRPDQAQVWEAGDLRRPRRLRLQRHPRQDLRHLRQPGQTALYGQVSKYLGPAATSTPTVYQADGEATAAALGSLIPSKT